MDYPRRLLGAAVVLAVTAVIGCGDDGGAAAPAATGAATTTSSTGTSTTNAPRLVAPDLQTALDQFLATQDVEYSVVAVHLPTGARAEHLADRQVLSASLYKLFVAAELLRQVHAGEIERADPAGDAEGRTIEECVRAMIVVSDNPCGVAGLERLGRGRFDDDLATAGFAGTSLASPQRTTAADVAAFIERAAAGTVLGGGPSERAAAAELYDLLRAQEIDDRLSLGFPPTAPFAHKTGDRLGWAHDAGIVTTPSGDLLIAVLSGPWPPPCCDAEKPGPAEAVAFSAIADLGRALYTAALA